MHSLFPAKTATRRRFISLLIFLLPVAFLISLKHGTVAIGWQELFSAFGLIQKSVDKTAHIILWELRLPRLLIVAATGASLALSGAVMQGIFRNALADPALLGISSGGALAVVLVLVSGIAPLSSTAESALFLPSVAFLGGIVVTVFVYQVARRHDFLDNTVILLIGIAINALAAAAIGFITFISSDAELRGFIFWMFGSFADIGWIYLFPIAVLMLPALVFLLCMARPLNALSLGDEDAVYLGFNIERIKKIALLCVALCVCASVAVAGIIGFVGLVVPHLVRLIIGADHRFLLPATAIIGALFLLLADTIARVILQPSELPIGILTAMVGVPLFVLLVLKQHSEKL